MATGDVGNYGGRAGSRVYESSSVSVVSWQGHFNRILPAPSPVREWVSWIIPVFAVANISMFIVVMLVNDCPATSNARGQCVGENSLGKFSFQPLEQNPFLGPSDATLAKLGGIDWYRVVLLHERWRLFSSIWLHAGVFHLLVNIICMFAVGIYLEKKFGFIKIGVIYLLSGFGGSILSALFLIPNRVSVGGSGALFGLLGAMLADTLINWTIYSNKIASIVALAATVLINFIIGLLPRVDNFAHIGGFLSGVLLGFIFLIQPRFGWEEAQGHPAQPNAGMSRYLLYQYVLWILSVGLFIVGFVTSLTLLFHGKNGNASCKWCHYLDCVPSSRWRC